MTSALGADGWARGVALAVEAVYTLANRGGPRLRDDRREFPWLVGHLGDHRADVWFVGWYPSLDKVRAVARKWPGRTDANLQWSAGDGDTLFRQHLADFGFKTGNPMDPDGWNCYMTNLVKRPIDVARWKNADEAARAAEYARWVPVLKWELEKASPRVLVLMGRDVHDAVLSLTGLPSLPRTAKILHYATFNPGQKNPAPPSRYEDYDREFGNLRDLANTLR